MKSAGEMLKNKRESLGLSISQVSSKLKIQEKYVLAMESNDSSVFDSKVIARGFLVKYCKLLDIDETKVLPFWRRDFVVSTPSSNQVGFSPKQTKFRVTPGVFAVLVVLTLVIGFLSFGFIQYYNFKKPPKLDLREPIDGQTYTTNQIDVFGLTNIGNELFLNNRELEMDSSGNFSEVLTISPGTNKLTFRVVSPLGIETVKNVTIYGDFNNQIDNESVEDVLLVENIGSSPVFVEVKTGQTTLFSGFLLESTQKEFKGSNLFFYTDTIESLKVLYNNEPIDTNENSVGEFIKTFD